MKLLTHHGHLRAWLESVAVAESEFKRKEDQLTTWIKDRDAKLASRDADILACLTGLPPSPPCGPTTGTPSTGA